MTVHRGTNIILNRFKTEPYNRLFETIMAELVVVNGYDKNNTQVYHPRRENVMVIAPFF